MARLTSWDEAFDFALQLGYETDEAVSFADQHFACPGCGEAECGATCVSMEDVLLAAIDGRRAA
jgi:hypothetical protein